MMLQVMTFHLHDKILINTKMITFKIVSNQYHSN